MDDSPLQLLTLRDPSELYTVLRRRATRRGAALRKSLGTATKDTKRYRDKRAPGTVATVTLAAERAFLRGLELREAGASKLLVRLQLKTCLKACTALLELAPSLSFALDVLGYMGLCAGAAAVNQGQYERLLVPLAVALVVVGFRADHPQATNELVWRSVVAEQIDPYWRLAVARAGSRDPHALVRDTTDGVWSRVRGLLAEVGGGVADGGAEPVEVAWRKYRATVSHPDTARLVRRAQGLEADPASPSLFEALLEAWMDALSLHADQKEAHDESDTLYVVVGAYCRFQVLVTRVRRDCALVGTLAAANAVAVYDNVVATCAELAGVPGVFNDDELAASVATVGATYRGKKLAMLARGYLARREFAEAYALARAGLHAVAYPVELHELTNLGEATATQDELVQLATAAQVLALLARHGAMALADLNRWVGEADIGFTAALALEPVPVKPVLFDIAYEYLGAAAPAPKPAKPATPAPAAPAKKSLFGLWK